MKFVIYKASNPDYEEYRTFNTLEELMQFTKETDYEVIIGGEAHDDSGIPSILIYDDYLE